MIATKVLVIGFLLGALGLTSGCAAKSTPGEPQNPPTESAPAPTPESRPENSPEDPDASALRECSPDVAAQIEEVIRAQTAALAEGDFVTAHSYASASFRLGVSVQAFEALIVSDYEPLLTASRLEFSSCFEDPTYDAAAIDVQLGGAGDGVFQLRYGMVESEEGWRVNQASNLESLGSRS